MDQNTEIILDAIKKLGYNQTDPNSEQQIVVVKNQFTAKTAKNGLRKSSNTVRFIRPIRKKRSSLIIKTQSYVKKIIIVSKIKRAICVEFICSKTGSSVN